jgi:hypothetical protein
MFGISSDQKEQINGIIDRMFDNIAIQFLGELPRLKSKKTITFNTRPDYSLSHLFVQALKNRKPTDTEKDMLKSILESAMNYVDALKNKTKASLTEKIDSLIREKNISKKSIAESDINDLIEEEMRKAKYQMKVIVEAESNKFKNLGTAMEITKVSSEIGDSDPTVFFQIVRDNKVCKECVRLHLMPDGVTPRLWKLSELKHDWHKRGENTPSINGLHPNCRCALSYLTKGFGFDQSGKLTYKSQNFDAYSKQKK